MLPMYPFALSATIIALLDRAAFAQDFPIHCDTSVKDDFAQALSHPNATGSYIRSSPLPPGNDTTARSSWTYRTAINVEEDEKVWQRFWVEFPNDERNQNDDLKVCGIAFGAMSFDTYSNGQDDTGDCLKTLNQECIDAIKRVASAQCSDPFPGSTKGMLPQCEPFGLTSNTISGGK